jgi:hypothetical protein
VKLTTHLYLVPRSKNVWSYTSIPPIHLHGVVLIYSTGTNLPLPSPEAGVNFQTYIWEACMMSGISNAIWILKKGRSVPPRKHETAPLQRSFD